MYLQSSFTVRNITKFNTKLI